MITKEDEKDLPDSTRQRKREGQIMQTIQHPFQPAQVIELGRLLDLIAYELEVIEEDELSARTGVGFLNDVVLRVSNSAERRLLTDAICERFIGD